MVIDSSAILAILLGEPEAEKLAKAIVNDSKRLISAVSALEASIVINTKKGALGEKELDLLLYKVNIDIVSMNQDQVTIARKAYDKFGKGKHPARLNLGDCCAYALARYSNERLLFKGEDFSKTDIDIVTLI